MLLKLVQGTRARVQRGGGVVGFFVFLSAILFGVSSWNPTGSGIASVGIQLAARLRRWNPTGDNLRRWNPTLSSTRPFGIQILCQVHQLESKLRPFCGVGIQLPLNPSFGIQIRCNVVLESNRSSITFMYRRLDPVPYFRRRGG